MSFQRFWFYIMKEDKVGSRISIFWLFFFARTDPKVGGQASPSKEIAEKEFRDAPLGSQEGRLIGKISVKFMLPDKFGASRF